MQHLRLIDAQLTIPRPIRGPERGTSMNATLIVYFAAVLVTAWFAGRYVGWPWVKLQWRDYLLDARGRSVRTETRMGHR